MALTAEDQVVLRCARQQFADAERAALLDFCRQQRVSWQAVYDLAGRHGIAPLVNRNLERCAPELAVPDEVRMQFALDGARNRRLKDDRALMLDALLAYFGARGIPLMLVKGAAADRVLYEQPWYTESGDIDLVLKAPPGSFTDADIRAAIGQARACIVEWECWAHHDVTINGVLPVDFARIWADAVPLDCRGRAAFVMSPEDSLIALCIGGCRRRFQRLKPLVDVAETVACWPDLDWHAVCARARAYDCRAIVYAALSMARLALGCAIPAGVMQGLSLRLPRRALIDSLCRRLASRPLAAWSSHAAVRVHDLDTSLVLTHASYQPYQLWRKLRLWLAAPHQPRVHLPRQVREPF